MPEWSTYSLSDFLMFAPRTYYRLIELYNGDVWPAHLVAIAVGLAAIAVTWRREADARRTAHLVLAAAWACVAWGWLHRRLAAIDWSATGFAVAFALEAALLLAVAAMGTPSPATPASRRLRAGGGLALGAVAAYPLLGLADGRNLASAEVFGLMPNPTAIATLGLLANERPALRWLLFPIPVAWCAIAGATLWTMGTSSWWVPPVAAATAIAIALRTPSGAGTRAGTGTST
jgi:hypothetical protein